MLNVQTWIPVAAWRASRLPLARFMPLALLIAGAAASHADRALQETLIRFPVAFLLVAQFRLWDDIVDRARDRLHHPDRVLTDVDAIGAFLLTATLLGVVNVTAVALLNGAGPMVGLLMLHALLAAWYGLRTKRDLWHAHALLLKYPAFVLILSTEPASLPVAAGAALIYAAMCMFELFQRRRDVGRQLVGEVLLVSHTAVLCVLPVMLAPSSASSLVCAGSLLALGLALLRGEGSGYGRYVPFATAAAALWAIKGGIA